MRYILDGDRFTDKYSAYEYLIEAFDLPEYQGHNLDALWDSLSMFKGEIVIRNARRISERMGNYGIRLLNVLGDLDKLDGLDVIMRW